MPSKVGIIYGIHLNEVPAIQVGRLIQHEGMYPAFQVDSSHKRHKNYESILTQGPRIFVDLHCTDYECWKNRQHSEKRQTYSVPVIPLANGRKQSDLLSRESVRELGKRFGSFVLTSLQPGSKFETGRFFSFENGGWNFEGFCAIRMKPYHMILDDSGQFGKVLTVEYYMDKRQMRHGVDAETAETFKQDTYWFAHWAKRNSRSLFL